jgi:hypothetical protein
MGAHKLQILLIVVLSLIILWQQADRERSTGASSDSNTDRLPDPPVSRLQQRIDTLESDLDRETLARQSLERRLRNLEQAGPQNLEESYVNEPDEAAVETAGDDSRIPDKEIIEQRLMTAGMAPETIRAMQLVVDRNKLERLQLRDRAIREGWQDNLEYSERMHELSDPMRGLREEFGDQAYDLYLYSSGYPNRIQVREVFTGSAADLAGIKSGDIIVSYASSAMFSMTELRKATTEGVAGDTVLMEAVRSQQPYSTSLPRGPLGISMSMTRVEPNRGG